MALTRPRAYQIYDIDYKQAVRVVAITNVTLAGGAPNTVDGVGLSLNDRVLVVGQSSAAQNGIYYVTTLGSGSNGTWARSTDTNATGELLSGTIVMVTEGTTYADTQWKLTTNDPIVIGSTELTFVQNYLANSISYGQTSFAIGSSNANATVSVAGTSNVAVFSTSGVNVAGNVSATYLIGNGSQLTGISASSSGFPIEAGTSNIAAAANSNIRISIAGTSNISVFSTSGQNVTGNITASGNVTGGNLTTAGQLVASTATMSGATTVGVLYVGASGTAAQIATNGGFDDWIGINKTTGNSYIGGGSQTGFISVGQGTANSTVYIARGATTNFGVKTISIGDNGLAGSNTLITIGNTAGIGNVTVSANTRFTISNTSGTALSVAGNVTGGNLTTAGQVTATGNVTGGNLITSGLISATGNITSAGNISGSYILGNGSQLTGIVSGNSFGVIAVSGQSDVVADQATDTLTLTAGTGISITTDAVTDTITINSTASSSIFVTGGSMGTVTDAVTVSDDLGLVTDAATVEYDLGTETTSGIVTPSLLLLPSYTVAQLGSLTAAPAGQFVFCSNESGGSIPAFSDGTNWRRVSDRSIVS